MRSSIIIEAGVVKIKVSMINMRKENKQAKKREMRKEKDQEVVVIKIIRTREKEVDHLTEKDIKNRREEETQDQVHETFMLQLINI